MIRPRLAGFEVAGDSERSGRRVPFREATIHHVVEHTVGGPTMLQNGVLICPECHLNRDEMQHLTSHFQEYLRRIYANPMQQPFGGVVSDVRSSTGDGQSNAENDTDENGPHTAAGKLKIVIDWGALDVEHETQTIVEDKDSESIIKLLVELIGRFGDSMKQQLTELPVIRYPLSKDPATAFLNRARGNPMVRYECPEPTFTFVRNRRGLKRSSGLGNFSPS